MKVKSTKHFEKHLKKCPADVQKKFVECYDELIKAKDIRSVDCEKLKGYKTFWKIRMGNYRVGFELQDENTIELLEIMDRKEIYRYFP
ncbi:MAG: type II toxin-antitoxin system RelE/ParE family toxin [Cytophagales bacterium]|jgi:mRNA interferase RelE/StbE|nr:type II toxin-antitoxin system RelE/ParE family toxin [Cytophagales bacterium]MCA6430890.1 type II toxin-antitoxin system RelE/ParE family toxin [Cytophagales bacterium]